MFKGQFRDWTQVLDRILIASGAAALLAAGLPTAALAQPAADVVAGAAGTSLDQCLESMNCQGISLVDEDLAGLNLSSVDFTAADFTGANLNGANLTGANLTNAVLYRAKGAGAVFKDAIMVQANLTDAAFTGANFSGAGLYRAQMANGDFRGSNFSHARLNGAFVQRAAFDNANFTGANLYTLSNLESGKGKAKASFVDITCATGPPYKAGSGAPGMLLGDCVLPWKAPIENRIIGGFSAPEPPTVVDLAAAAEPRARVKLSKGKCKLAPRSNCHGHVAKWGVNHKGKSLHHIRLTDSQLHGARFTNTNMNSADLRGAVLHRARFKNVTLHGADLSPFGDSPTVLTSAAFHRVKANGADFRRVNLDNATISHSSLTNANFSGGPARIMATRVGARSDDSSCTMSGSTFSQTDLSGTNYSGCDLSGAIFDGVKLNSVNFTGANLHKAQFTNIKSAAGAKFSGAQLVAATLQGNFDDADFTGVDLGGVYFGGSFSGATFREADFAQATYERGVDFSHADLSNTTRFMLQQRSGTKVEVLIQYPNLDGANLAGAKMLGSWKGGSAAEANFTGASFLGLPPQSADLRGAVLTKAKASCLDESFRNEMSFGLAFYGPSGIKVDQNTVFNYFDCDMQGVEGATAGKSFAEGLVPYVSGTNLYGWQSVCASGTVKCIEGNPVLGDKGATLLECAPDCRGVDLHGRVLTGNMAGTNFTDANLEGVKFISYLVKKSPSTSTWGDVFYQADLSGAKFLNAKLSGAQFTVGTVLDGASFINSNDTMISNVEMGAAEDSLNDYVIDPDLTNFEDGKNIILMDSTSFDEMTMDNLSITRARAPGLSIQESTMTKLALDTFWARGASLRNGSIHDSRIQSGDIENSYVSHMDFGNKCLGDPKGCWDETTQGQGSDASSLADVDWSASYFSNVSFDIDNWSQRPDAIQPQNPLKPWRNISFEGSELYSVSFAGGHENDVKGTYEGIKGITGVIEYVNFYNAKLEKTTFQGVGFYRTRLDGATLGPGMRIYAVAIQTGTKEAFLPSTHQAVAFGLPGLKQSNIYYVIGPYVDLSGTNLSGTERDVKSAVSLDGADFSGATLGRPLYLWEAAPKNWIDQRESLVKFNIGSWYYHKGITFAGAIMNAMDWSGQDLENVNLDGAHLQFANFDKANINGASLRGTNLHAASFSGVQLSGADLTNANLSYATITYDANLTHSKFIDADMTGITIKCDNWWATLGPFKCPDASGAIMRRANLRGADLAGANFTRVELTDADLSNANLTGTNLTVAFLAYHLANTNFTDAILTNAIIGPADATNSTWINADMQGARLNRVDFSKANLKAARMQGATVYMSNFTDASLSQGADLSRAVLTSTNLTRANLSGAILLGTELLTSNLSYATVDDPDLKDASLCGTTMPDASTISDRDCPSGASGTARLAVSPKLSRSR